MFSILSAEILQSFSLKKEKVYESHISSKIRQPVLQLAQKSIPDFCLFVCLIILSKIMVVETLQSLHLYIHQIVTEVLEGFLYRKLRSEDSAPQEYAVWSFS